MHKPKRFPTAGLPFTLAVSLALSGAVSAGEFPKPEEDYNLKLLGKYVFFDKISQVNNDSGATPSRMGCVTCHDPDAGGTYFVAGVNKKQVAVTGANPHTIGGRKPPSNAYANFAQAFTPVCPGAPAPCGGNFWDGRSTGTGDVAYTDGEGNPTTTEHISAAGILAGLDPALVGGYDKYFGPTTDQALNPMPNPVEQNIQEQTVCEVVASAGYAPLYAKAFGEEIDCGDDPARLTNGYLPYQLSFRRLMLSVGAYQHSSDINSFSSPRDIALETELACGNAYGSHIDPAVCAQVWAAKTAQVEILNDREKRAALGAPELTVQWAKFPLGMLSVDANFGHDIFYSEINEVLPGPPGVPPVGNDADGNGFLRNVNCSFCHSSSGPNSDGTDPHELYTENVFHHLGLPANPALPPDPGLSGVTGDQLTFVPFPPRPGAEPAPVNPGWFRNATLRNVDKRPGKGFTKAYMHNGVFKSLETVTHFYNTMNVNGATAAAYGITRCVDEAGQPVSLMTEAEMVRQNCWPLPEYPITGTTLPAAGAGLIGNMGMSPEDEAAVVAYMVTLSDTHTAKAPKPYVNEK